MPFLIFAFCEIRNNVKQNSPGKKIQARQLFEAIRSDG